MDKINYLSNTQAVASGKYPVTLEGLEFIQKQIGQLQQLAEIGGGCYLIQPSRSEAPVICVIRGEVLPLMGVRNAAHTHIQIVTTEKQTILTDSGDYRDVREVRVAQYAKHATAAYRDHEWTPLGDFKPFAPNTELLERIDEIADWLKNSRFLTAKWGVYSLNELDGEGTAARIFCKKGSVSVGGWNHHTVDVYAADGMLYQELTTPDFRRYGRYRNAASGVWEPFRLLDDQLQLEAKVIRGCLYLRHGFLPPYARIVLLRKKRRNRKAGTNLPNRSVKCAWFHGYKMVLSTGEPNKWYVPRCIAAAGEAKTAVGKEFATAINQLLYRGSEMGRRPWRLRGVSKRWRTGLIHRAYARLALAVLTSVHHSEPVHGMLRLRFRVWQEANSIRKSLSVE